MIPIITRITSQQCQCFTRTTRCCHTHTRPHEAPVARQSATDDTALMSACPCLCLFRVHSAALYLVSTFLMRINKHQHAPRSSAPRAPPRRTPRAYIVHHGPRSTVHWCIARSAVMCDDLSCDDPPLAITRHLPSVIRHGHFSCTTSDFSFTALFSLDVTAASASPSPSPSP